MMFEYNNNNNKFIEEKKIVWGKLWVNYEKKKGLGFLEIIWILKNFFFLPYLPFIVSWINK